MTIGAIILDIILLISLIFIIIAVYSNAYEDELKLAIFTGVIGFVLIGTIFGGQLWYYSSTEMGKRAIKTQESNFNEGLKREVKVYSMDGKLLEEYTGKFDVDYDDDRVIFDDEKGNRHIIYYPTGTVIINELGGKNE